MENIFEEHSSLLYAAIPITYDPRGIPKSLGKYITRVYQLVQDRDIMNVSPNAERLLVPLVSAVGCKLILLESHTGGDLVVISSRYYHSSGEIVPETIYEMKYPVMCEVPDDRPTTPTLFYIPRISKDDMIKDDFLISEIVRGFYFGRKSKAVSRLKAAETKRFFSRLIEDSLDNFGKNVALIPKAWVRWRLSVHVNEVLTDISGVRKDHNVVLSDVVIKNHGRFSDKANKALVRDLSMVDGKLCFKRGEHEKFIVEDDCVLLHSATSKLIELIKEGRVEINEVVKALRNCLYSAHTELAAMLVNKIFILVKKNNKKEKQYVK